VGPGGSSTPASWTPFCASCNESAQSVIFATKRFSKPICRVSRPLTAHAVATPEGSGENSLLLTLLRSLDLLVLALALPLFLIAGWPPIGWAVVTVVWIAQRWIVATVKRRALATGNRAAVMRAISWSMMIRLALVTSSVAIVGIVDRDAGLPAAVLAAVLFSIALGTQISNPTPVEARR
jgi:hypothetical protein